MSEKSVGLDDPKENQEIEAQKDLDKDLDRDADLKSINESREDDYERDVELEEELAANDEFDDLEGFLEDGVENVEESLGWIEAGVSTIGGGVPMMEGGGSFEDAIRDALEGEFSPEELAQSGAEEAKNQEMKKEGSMEGLMDSSGPDMQPRKGGK